MTASDDRKRTSSGFAAELDGVKKRVLAAGALAQRQIEQATHALVTLDWRLAERVEDVERLIDRAEMDIDEDCSRILVRRQPAASDLRLVYAMIKTASELERIGDEAAKIARLAHGLASKKRTREHMLQVRHLSNQVRAMVRDAMAALESLDPAAALAVARQDVLVDREYESLVRQLMTYMMEDVRYVGPVIDILFCVRALERIGDHAKNIAEFTIYLVKGKDVRHVGIEALERQVLGSDPP